MTNALLVLNAGSSSLKFRLFQMIPDLPCVVMGKVSGIGERPTFQAHWPAVAESDPAEVYTELPLSLNADEALTHVLNWLTQNAGSSTVQACAHRIVHGGHYDKAIELDRASVDELRLLTALAPLHQEHNLAAVDTIWKANPAMRQFGCFDTAFHAHHDRLHREFALPAPIRAQGIQRYGFHGLSYAWIAHRLKCDHPKIATGKIVVAHLGNGSSICAMHDGKSIDTTMGMTTLDGPPMGTRCGALDPGALIYMQQNLRMSIQDVEDILYSHSGLKGLSGISGDMKVLLDSDIPRARFAIDFYALKTAQHIAAMITSLGGIDTLVFTGGIGENAGLVRDKILGSLTWLGTLPTLVIPANEERYMAQDIYRSQFA